MKQFAGCILIVGILVTLGCTGEGTTSPRVAVPPAPQQRFERDFLQNRIAHQQAALEMARTCIQKAQREQLKTFCSGFVKTEEAEMKQMEDWYRSWYPGNAALPPEKEKMTQGYERFLGSVRSSTGVAFEEALLRALRVHHREGVQESGTCIAGAVRTELKQFCMRVRDEQGTEIQAISVWICQWFKDCLG